SSKRRGIGGCRGLLPARGGGVPRIGGAHAQPDRPNPAEGEDLFGADAVLFVTVENSSTSYFVVGSSVSATLDYELKDTRTGKSLWHRALTVAQGSDVIAPVGGGLVAPAAVLALTMADAALT